MSFGQLLFVLLTILVMAGAGFYLGVKFGPQMARWHAPDENEAKFLPEDALALEVKKLLESTPVDYSFFEVVKDKNDYPAAAQSLAAEIPLVKIEKPKELAVVEPEKPADVVKASTDKTVSEVAKTEVPKVEVAQVEAPKVEMPKVEAPKVVPPKVETVKKVEVPATVKTPPVETTELANAELSQTKYLLQIGSYDSAKKAEKAKETWAKRGFNPEIVIAQIPGKGQWYRLRLGLYDDYSVIQSHQKNIQNKYRESAVILPIQ